MFAAISNYESKNKLKIMLLQNKNGELEIYVYGIVTTVNNLYELVLEIFVTAGVDQTLHYGL